MSDAYTDLILSRSPTAYWTLGEPYGTTMADETGNHNTLIATHAHYIAISAGFATVAHGLPTTP